MPWRPHSRARVDPRSPAAWGSCDRCGLTYNLRELVWEMQWRGPRLMKTGFLVCTATCLDVPQAQLRPRILPPDPVPVFNPRPEQFAAENGLQGLTLYTVDPPTGTIPQLRTISLATTVTCAIASGFSPNNHGYQASPPFFGTAYGSIAASAIGQYSVVGVLSSSPYAGPKLQIWGGTLQLAKTFLLSATINGTVYNPAAATFSTMANNGGQWFWTGSGVPSSGHINLILSAIDPTATIPFTKSYVLSSVATISGIATPSPLTDYCGLIGSSQTAQTLLPSLLGRSYLLLFNPTAAPLAVSFGTAAFNQTTSIILYEGQALLWATSLGQLGTGGMTVAGFTPGQIYYAWQI